MDTNHTDPRLWEQEQLFLKSEKEKYPDLFIAPTMPPEQLLERVGITTNTSSLPKGCLKVSPLDFIVEEVMTNNSVVDISGSHIELEENISGEGTVYANLIKVGMSTLDAVGRIALSLCIDSKQIGFAGIKDSTALTSQRISIRGVTEQQVDQAIIPGVLLTDVQKGKGSIVIGDLQGNRFTIFVRTDASVQEDVFSKQLSDISKNGVINFYGTQRFGEPRYLSHHFGRLFLAGKHRELIQTHLFETSPFENKYITGLRIKASGLWGKWAEIDNLYSVLPYTFRFERIILEVLKKDNSPQCFSSAIIAIWEQIKFWTKSYASYLANLELSKIASSDKASTSEKLPLLLSTDYQAIRIYQDKIRQDQILDFRQSFRGFPYNYISRLATISTRIYPIFHGWRVIPGGVALSFTLPKAAYATTVLMSLFNIYPQSLLPNISHEIFDTKNLLGEGDLNSIQEYFYQSLAEANPTPQEES